MEKMRFDSLSGIGTFGFCNRLNQDSFASVSSRYCWPVFDNVAVLAKLKLFQCETFYLQHTVSMFSVPTCWSTLGTPKISCVRAGIRY